MHNVCIQTCILRSIWYTYLCCEDPILYGELIRWERLRRPLADFHIIGQDGLQLEWLAHRDLPLNHVHPPVLHDHAVTELP